MFDYLALAIVGLVGAIAVSIPAWIVVSCVTQAIRERDWVPLLVPGFFLLCGAFAWALIHLSTGV